MSKVVLLTGSSRGLGRQIAEAVLAAGHQLVATARRPETLSDLAERYGSQILPVTLDGTDPAGAQAAVAAGIKAFGRLDVLVNNAGYANLASVEDITLDDFREQLDANLLGVVYLTKAALPVMRQQGSGHIIQVSSIGGRLATPGLSAYQAAKWAVGPMAELHQGGDGLPALGAARPTPTPPRPAAPGPKLMRSCTTSASPPTGTTPPPPTATPSVPGQGDPVLDGLSQDTVSAGSCTCGRRRWSS
jgi:nucleoside-diphosphate-sugar epimerase